MAIDGGDIIFFLTACTPGGASVVKNTLPSRLYTNCNSRPLKGLASSREVSPLQFHLQSRLPHSHIAITRKQLEMCRRRVVVAEFSCGHQEPVEESVIDCGSTTCRYSANHIQGDHDHNACNQWMNPAERVDGPPRTGQCSMHRG